jgi:PAS domain S-box-containing protein
LSIPPLNRDHVWDVADFGPFRLFATARRLERNGELVEIRGRALDVLIELVNQAGRVVTRTELLSTLWADTSVVEGVIRTHVYNLRKVLGDGVGGMRYIASIAGRGYCFVAPVIRGMGASATAAVTRIAPNALTNRCFIHWSSELFAIHGLPPGKVPSIADYLAVVHPEDRASVTAQIQELMARPRDFDFTKRIIRPDGAVRYVRCVGVATGHGGRLFGTGMDVTEQEELANALRKRESELQQMLDFAPQLVSVVGAAGDHIHINQMALAYLGVSLEEWKSTQLTDEVHPDDLERITCCKAEAEARGAAYELELRIRRHDGIYRWFLARFNPVRDDSGQVIRWYHACTDIEDRKRAEEQLRQENVTLREDIDQGTMFEEIIGTSGALQPVLTRVAKVARSQSTVMLTGETGTGKELVARAIHRRSSRGDRGFVGVNCAAIPRALVASELFGHEQGAFAGATQRRLGRLELAHGGTLFLDEVGELSIEIQIALLRVLQERELKRVGGTTAICVDVRLIAATNRDLHAAIEAGTFRADLFYRLNVYPIVVPPLRERTEDISLLVEYFVDRYARQVGKTIRRIAKRTLDHLQAYPWPGNVRELQDVIERSIIVCETDELVVDESWLSIGSVAEIGVLPQVVATHEKP